MSVHRVILRYTTDDDGVWLECLVCRWHHHLGFDATPGQAVVAANAHLSAPDEVNEAQP